MATSRMGRYGKDRVWDFYETAPWMVHGLMAHVPITGRIIEPCSGEHAISGILRKDYHLRVITNDWDPKRTARYHADARDPKWWRHILAKHPADWVITNPPFKYIYWILVAMWHYRPSHMGLVLKARLSFLEPTRQDPRGAWLDVPSHMPNQMLVDPRYRFKGKGTDSVTTAWLIWLPGYLARPRHPILVLHDAPSRYADRVTSRRSMRAFRAAEGRVHAVDGSGAYRGHPPPPENRLAGR